MSARNSTYAMRARAARAYADLSQSKMASRINLGYETYQRVESGEREPTLEERRAIAEACGVPDWFMEAGFEGHEQFVRSFVDERMQEMERSIRSVIADQQRLKERVAAAASQDEPGPVVLPEQDAQPNPETPPQDQTDEEAGGAPDAG